MEPNTQRLRALVDGSIFTSTLSLSPLNGCVRLDMCVFCFCDLDASAITVFSALRYGDLFLCGSKKKQKKKRRRFPLSNMDDTKAAEATLL